jgi:hypothetical protein
MDRRSITQQKTADHLLATWGEVLVIVWHDRTTLEGVQAGQRFYDALAETCPSGVFLLTVVEEKAQFPEAAVRKQLAKLLASGAGRTRKSALVYEGSGFNASIVRSIVTGLTQLSSVPYPHKVFATVDEAARFFAPDLGVPAPQIAEAIRGVRQTARWR